MCFRVSVLLLVLFLCVGTAFHAMQLSAIRSHSRSFSENSAENSGCRSSISSTLRRHSRTKALHGTYLPPEMDPEYRNVYKPTAKLRPVNSTTALGADLLPLPKVGDLVKYEGRWKDEETVGRIRYLNYIEDYKAWYADIVPLKPGVAADDIYIIDRNSRAEYLPTDQIVPIKSSYVRAENAYRVYFDKAGPTTGSTEKPTKALSVKAPAYRTIEKDTPLRNKQINADNFGNNLEMYETLKKRLITNSLKFGAACTIPVTALLGLDFGGYFFLGVGAGAVYLFLLGVKVDTIGADYAAKYKLQTKYSDDTNPILKRLANARLLVPLVLLVALSAKDYLDNSYTAQYLQLVTKQQYIASMSGFVSIRFALFISEVTKEIRSDDWLNFIPGSVAEGIRRYQAKESGELDEVQQPKPILFVTGPIAAGRTQLLAQWVKQPQLVNNVKRKIEYEFGKLLTTDSTYKNSIDSNFAYITVEELAELRRKGEVIYEGIDRDDKGKVVKVYASLSSLCGNKSENDKKPKENRDPPSPVVVVGPPELLGSLKRLENVAVSSIWISLQTKEQFVGKARSIIQNERGSEDVDEEEVSKLVQDAVGDINYFMQNSLSFDQTLINDYEISKKFLKDESDDSASIIDALKQMLLNL